MSVNLTKTATFTSNLIASLDKIVSDFNYGLKVESNKITISNLSLLKPFNTDYICDLIDKCTIDVLGKEFSFQYSVVAAGTVVFYGFE